MAITVNFYTFSKKTNSTKQPTGTAALSASCLLKDATSIISPVFQIRTSDPTTYNYCYCRAFHRYYFISDITWNKGYWEIRCKCDVLATYKTTIGSTNGYILRAANNSDGDIIDELYPATSAIDTEIAYSAYSTGWSNTMSIGYTDWSAGDFVVGVQGTGVGSVNGVIYYAMDAADLVRLINNFYANSGNNTWFGNLAKGVVNSIASLSDYIASIRWYPYPLVYSNTQTQIYLGSWPVVDGNNVPLYAFNLEDTRPCSREVTIMRHPQAATRGAYLNYAPYSHYEIVDPLVGVIPVNSDIAKVINTIKCTVTPDYTTGQAKYELTTAGDVVFYTTYINFAVDINLAGATGVNIGKVVAGLGAAASGFATGGATGFLGMAAGIGNAITEGTATPGGNQSSGGFVQYGSGQFMLRGYFKPIVNEDKTNKGRPYCTWNNPATVLDYMVIDNPHVAVAGTAQEIDQINGYLASGFYYE